MILQVVKLKKLEENKFLQIYLSGENFSVKNWRRKINFINLFGHETRKNL